MATSRDLLITIDREEWQSVRKFEIHKKEWWAFRLKRFDWLHGIGRTIYRVSLDNGTATPLFTVPQLVDRELLQDLLPRMAVWAKSLSRGLRTIWYESDGTVVLADIFGVYRMTTAGEVLKYLSIPQFADIHCAYPGRDSDHLLVTCTGTEEVIEVHWDGAIVERIVMSEVFDTGVNNGLKSTLEAFSDRRRMALDHSKHVFHVNWAQYLSDGSILISCHTPGLVACLRKNGSGCWKVAWQRGYFPHCHCPALDEERGVFYVAVSRADEVRAVSVETGETLWKVGKIRYGKGVLITGPDHVVVGDCNGKRLVEIERETGKVTREVALPGIPYGLCLVPE